MAAADSGGLGVWGSSPLAIGIRDYSMRTLVQFQQNFPRELAISEAPALAGVDALQFRIDHADEERSSVCRKLSRMHRVGTPAFTASGCCVRRISACARPRNFADVPHLVIGNCIRHTDDAGGF